MIYDPKFYEHLRALYADMPKDPEWEKFLATKPDFDQLFEAYMKHSDPEIIDRIWESLK